MLQVSKLATGYGRIPILHGVSLFVDEGECLGVLGHNGMGKSTLLKAIAGRLPISGGGIVFKGRNVERAPAYERARLGIGYVPQGRMIFPSLTVRENLRMGAAGVASPTSIVEEVLEDIPQLQPLLTRAGGVLSGGEQQLLALARCLCGSPEVMLLDEPTEGVQPSIVEEMVGLLQRLRRRNRLAIVLVEQKLSFLQNLADRLLVLQKGSIRIELSRTEASDSERVERLLNADETFATEDT